MVEESKEFSSDEYKLLIESFVTTDDIKLKLLEIKELSEKRIADEEIKILLGKGNKKIWKVLIFKRNYVKL